MKTIGALFLLVVVSLICGTASVKGQGTGCSGGKRSDGVFYTDCFPAIGGDTQDDERLQRAVNATTGKLMFNEAIYYVDEPVVLHSFISIEGMSPINYVHGGTDNPRIVLIDDNTDVFTIDEGIHEIAIRDLGFFYNGESPANDNVVAIRAESGNASNDPSSGFQFDNLRFERFTKGIYVNSTTSVYGWQYDNNHLQDSYFVECQTAIHLNSLNTGWHMNNIGFGSLADQNGLYIQRAGYVNINLMVGNGTRVSNVPASDEFIRIEIHGFVNIQNANGEAYKKTLIINGPDDTKGTPIILANSDFQECHWDSGTKPSVVIKNATVVSQGNSYLCVGEVARPSIEGWAEVYSTGDKFCLEGSAQCLDTGDPYDETTRSGWAIKSAAALVRTDGIGDLYDNAEAFVDFTSTYSDTTPPFKPLLSLTDSFYSAGTYTKWRYTFSLNRNTRRLELDSHYNGNSAGVPSYIGYYFKNGPVQLHSTTQSGLSSYNTVTGSGDSGSLLYCSDCTAGSTPCAGSGSGALALRVGSAWHCK